MKKFYLFLTIAAVVGISSCKEKKIETHNAMVEKANAEDFKPKYADVKFASDKDTICGMPISSGISDTLMLDGKVYGFCSADCKHNFDSVLVAEHKR